jgi:cyclophilin family peptidyl-prolyl cis-trans isomerase/HEAT repeat protein
MRTRVPILLIPALCFAVSACGRRPLQSDQVKRNLMFAEILDREDHRDLGNDDFFITHLRDTSQPRVQEWCAIALGRIANTRALPWLFEALHSRYAAVRAASAFALGEAEDRDLLRSEGRAANPRTAVELRGMLDDPALTVSMRAMEALGKAGRPEDATEIAARIQRLDYDRSPAVRTCVYLGISSLMRLRNPAVRPTLERLAAAHDVEIQWRALNALTRMGAREARPVFERCIRSADTNVRAYAARALGICGDPALATLLEPLLSAGEGEVRQPLAVRVSALQALTALQARQSAAAIEKALVASPIGATDPGSLDQLNFAVQAVSALGTLGAADNAPTLQRMTRLAAPVACGAVVALARVCRPDPETFFSLIGGTRFDTPAGMRAWASALGELGGARAQSELQSLLMRSAEDNAPSAIREALPTILQALARLQPAGLQEMIVTYLRARDGVVLRAALSAYQPPASLAAPWKPVLEAYAGITGGQEPETRAALLNSLAQWRDSLEVQTFLQSALRDPERNARIAAARILREAGVASIPADPGPAASRSSRMMYGLLASARQDRTLAILETARGTIEIELFREDAPVTVANFVALAQDGFFDGHTFMRVVPYFVIQGGDPRDDQEGGPGYAIRCEINMHPFERGSLGMALSGKDTGGSQFFITLSPQPHLDGGYTCFGRVISGMPAAEHMIAGDKILKVRIQEGKSFLDHRNY